jgi:AraC-like DNA-binding protein
VDLTSVPVERRQSKFSTKDWAGHIERVFSIAAGNAVSGDDKLAASWRRSANAHHIDPASGEAPRILTNGELKDAREPLARLIHEAREELDHLYDIVKVARYTVLFCNNRGIAIEHRGDEAEADEFKRWGIWLGGVWPEEVEGTNGIGTCAVEQRAVSVHHSEHFRARHINLSCSGAPIFDGDGKLAAILDVSSFDPQLSEQSHALTGALTEASARAIEERWFRDRFHREWIVAVAAPEGHASGMLFALDEDQCIVGADRRARTTLSEKKHRIEDGVTLWSVFEPAPLLFRYRNRGDIAGPLIPIATPEPWAALVTPPEAAGWGNPEMRRLHCRPRLDAIRHAHTPQSALPARGGLSPRSLRRVKEHIDTHLDKRLDLAMLAETAGLSVFHFARAFKRSEGITPHNYLLERRIKLAHKLLTTSNLSLSEIARASGFADQGHLARHMRRRVGVPPSTLRAKQ